MGPHRAPLIGERVISGIVGGERPNAPPAPQVLLQEALGHPRGMLGAGDPTPQHVSGVRGDRAHGLLRRVKRVGVAAEIFAPEARFKVGLEVERLLAQLASPAPARPTPRTPSAMRSQASKTYPWSSQSAFGCLTGVPSG